MKSYVLALIVAVLVFVQPPPVLAQDHLAHGASGLAHGVPDFCAPDAVQKITSPATVMASCP